MIVFYGLNCRSQTFTQTMRRLPDTGQNSGYTSTFGEDNDFNINVPLFKLVNNGTVIDSITGLMWQVADGGEMTFSTALVYCASLSLGGYTNWRLPNAHEAFSILNHQYVNPSLNVSVFTANTADYWWTSDRQVNDSSFIFVTNAGGGIGNHPKLETISAGGTKRFHARAVRSIYSGTLLPSHYTNNTNSTVIDNTTGLMWQKIAFKDTLTWEDALHYADTASIGGYTDWRLPNVKEIQSINDEKRINPSVNTGYFSNIGIKKYWSSTTLPNQTLKAWYLDTQYGVVTYQLKTYKLNLLLVRGDGNIVSGLTKPSNQKEFVVYPNPFHQFINVETEKSDLEYQLIDARGQLIYTGKLMNAVDFSTLSDGIYLLKVSGSSTNFVKLIKE
ncbi:MAG: DUF1566 domain-containing protein [Bacteroidota bacterium]